MEKDYLEKDGCHHIHYTVTESVNYANEALGYEISYLVMGTMLDFFIVKCGKRKRINQSGRPAILYNEVSVRKLIEFMREHRGKL